MVVAPTGRRDANGVFTGSQGSAADRTSRRRTICNTLDGQLAPCYFNRCALGCHWLTTFRSLGTIEAVESMKSKAKAIHGSSSRIETDGRRERRRVARDVRQYRREESFSVLGPAIRRRARRDPPADERAEAGAVPLELQGRSRTAVASFRRTRH